MATGSRTTASSTGAIGATTELVSAAETAASSTAYSNNSID